MTHSDRDASERSLNRVTSAQDATATTPAPQGTAAQIKAAQNAPRRLTCDTGHHEVTTQDKLRAEIGGLRADLALVRLTILRVEALAADWPCSDETCDGECTGCAYARDLRDALSAPADPPLHEQTDRDGDNVPSDERWQKYATGVLDSYTADQRVDVVIALADAELAGAWDEGFQAGLWAEQGYPQENPYRPEPTEEPS